jgi:hypothetical protein
MSEIKEEIKLKPMIGNPVTDESFWNRDDELREFIRLVKEGRHLRIVAPRRMGKTSLIREAARRLKPSRECLFVDLSASVSAEDAIAEMSVATGAVQGLWTKLRSVFSGFVESLGEVVSEFEIASVKLSLRDGFKGDWERRGEQLFGVFASHDKPVVLLLDEVAILASWLLHGSGQRITEERARNTELFFTWLRKMSTRHPGQVITVLTGSIGLEPMLRRAGTSTALHAFAPFELRPWSSEKATACLRALAAYRRIKLDDDVPERMVDLLGVGVPGHVQIFFDEIYKDSVSSGRSDFAVRDVERLFRERMLGPRVEMATYEERLWQVVGVERLRLVKALLTEAAVSGYLRDETAIAISARHGASPDELRLVFEILVHDGYLVRDEGGHRFLSNFLCEWWKAQFGTWHRFNGENV